MTSSSNILENKPIVSEVFDMWKLLNTSVTTMFNNMENTNSFVSFANMLQADEKYKFTCIRSFPQCETFEESSLIDHDYKSFNMWLFGRLFYVIGCDKLKEIHNQYIELQKEMLDYVKKQANIYNALVLEYFSVLNKIKNNSKYPIVFDNFHMPQRISKNIIDLSPIFVKLSSQEECISLQDKVLNILTKVLFGHLQNYASLFENVDIIYAKYFIKMLEDDGCHMFNDTDNERNVALIEYFYKILSCIHNSVCYNWHTNEDLESIVVNLLMLVNKYSLINNDYIENDIYEICEILIQRETDLSIVYSVMEVIIMKRDCSFDAQNILKKPEAQSLIKTAIIIEMKNYGCSRIWDLLCSEVKSCISSFNTNDIGYLKHSLQIAQYVHEKAPNSLRFDPLKVDFIVEILKLENFFMKQTNTADDYVFCIYCIMLMINSEENKDMYAKLLSLIANPVCKEENVFNERIDVVKKIKSLTMLSACFRSNMSNQILQWFENCIKHPILVREIPNLLPTILSSCNNIPNVMTNILIPLISSTDLEVSRNLTKNMGEIICILNGEYKIIFKHNPFLEHSILCLHCDANRSEVTDVSVKQENYLLYDQPKLFLTFLDSSDSVIKRNMVECLIRMSKHMDRFYLPEICTLWLEYINDDERDIRYIMSYTLNFLINNCLENQHINDERKEDVVDQCIFKCKMTGINSINRLDSDLQSTIIDTFKNIGCLKYKNIFLDCYLSLLSIMISGKEERSYEAMCALTFIFRMQNIKPKDFFCKYKQKIYYSISYSLIVKYLIICKMNDVLDKMNHVLNSIAAVLSDQHLDFTKLFEKEAQNFLPPLFVLMADKPKVKNLLLIISTILAVNLKDMIQKNFAYIYIHAYLDNNKNIFIPCMKYIEEITKTSVTTLKKMEFKTIYNQLLLKFHKNKNLVMEDLLELQKFDSKCSLSSKSNQERFVEYLEPSFLGFLLVVDSNLLTQAVSDEVKTDAILSLTEIIKLMGSTFITRVRVKVIATLKSAVSLAEEPFPELVCDTWNVFIRTCDIRTLGPLLSIIFISLLPMIKTCPRKVNSIFRYLIIDNMESLKDYFNDLFYLSETSVSQDIKITIERYLKQKDLAIREDLPKQLSTFCKYITNENKEVRIYGLKFLKNLLRVNQSKLDTLITGDVEMNDVIIELHSILVKGCRENDEQIQLGCADCLGELGAIEPSLFPMKFKRKEAFSFYITEDGFLYNALSEFIRGYQSAVKSDDNNRHCYVIQETLKYYGVSPDVNAPKHELWKKFPDNEKDLIFPLLSSKYNIVPGLDKEIKKHPIYGSELGRIFSEWLTNWTRYLISIAKDDKKNLMEVWKRVLISDYHRTILFLPYFLVHALLDGTEKTTELIYLEFNTILNLPLTKNKLNPERLKLRPLNLSRLKNPQEPEHTQDEYLKVIFILLDHLERWLLEWKFSSSHSDFIKIETFLNRFCKLTLSQCNYYQQEYPRALLYLERYIGQSPEKLKQNLGFLAKINAALDELDAVTGASLLRLSEPSLEEQLINYEMMGKLQHATQCYERMAQQGSLTTEDVCKMVRCYLEVDNPFTALSVAKGRPESHVLLYEAQAEPFWRLGMYTELKELLDMPQMASNSTWGVCIGHLLLNFRQKNRLGFQNVVNKLRKMLVGELTSTSLETRVYRFDYPQIIKFHILNELEQAERIMYKIIDNNSSTNSEIEINKMFREWDLRLKNVDPAVRMREPILRLRRIILEQSRDILNEYTDNLRDIINQQLAKYWLCSAKMNRLNKLFQEAHVHILKAQNYKLVEVFVEKAKYFWDKGESEAAINILKKGLDEHFSNEGGINLSEKDKKIYAEARKLMTMYNDETSNWNTNTILTHYQETIKIYNWDESYMKLGEYMERLLKKKISENDKKKVGEMQMDIVFMYGNALSCGSKYMYQAMPRMLSIWLEFDETSYLRSSMNKLMDKFLDKLPAYMFLSAFPQLVSRICHPSLEVFAQIRSILIKIILKYPQQSMWMIMGVSKSTYLMRSKRCALILKDPRLKGSQISTLITDMSNFVHSLIGLCNLSLSSNKFTYSMQDLAPKLVNYLTNSSFSQIAVPVQKLMKLIPPDPKANNVQSHEPFPHQPVYITKIEDEILVLQSMQRPRRIQFRGSDGKCYSHLMKPKDDLRKDFKLMQFSDVVNLYLCYDPEARRRRLHIRTYCVLPLNDECGIIEWVPHLSGLRNVLAASYDKNRGNINRARAAKEFTSTYRDTLDNKVAKLQKLLENYPPMLAYWFRQTFPDPSRWLEARTAFTSTAAVMSMVGFVLGLGDRHGENIMIDTVCGDVVHVDFSCLFNKGETFEVPERVPFRLTQNMINAMGPLGCEGLFRRTCEVTMRVLQNRSEPLLSTLRPFLYDPLVSWTTRKDKNVKEENKQEKERTNPDAIENVRNIELRLQGRVKSFGQPFSAPLSCEGQVEYLIKEAMDLRNLCQMYMGWGPHL